MDQLESLLLVQFAHKYGPQNLREIANGLQRHPLLTSKSVSTVAWTQPECRKALQTILAKERSAVPKNHDVSAEEIASLFHRLHSGRIAELKSLIKADEIEYRRIQDLRALKSPPNGEMPSSTQDSQEQAIAPPLVLPSQDGSDTRTSEHLKEEGTVVEPEVASILTKDDPVPDVSLQAQSANDEMQTVEVKDMHKNDEQSLVDTTKEALSVEEIEEAKDEEEDTVMLENDQDIAVPENKTIEPSLHASGEKVDDGEVDAGAMEATEDKEDSLDEIAVKFDNENVEVAPKIKDQAKAQPAVAESRSTRTRSSTLNTVASADTTLNDEYTADQSLKKKGPHSKKRVVSREERRSPTVSNAADELDTAASLKKFQSTIVPVLNNIASHRYASVFANPVSDREAPNYSSVIKCPMDIKSIKAQVKSGDITNVQSFHRAIALMLSNAIMYNPERSEVAKMAAEVFDHAEEVIAMYRAAEEMAEMSDDRTPKRRRRNEQ